MLTAILLALGYGILISLTRVANGRIGMVQGAFKSSFWNHSVGFVFLTLLIPLISVFMWQSLSTAPWYAFLGGVLGTFFVAINAYIIPRVGVTKSALLVVSGQMISGVLLSTSTQAWGNTVMQLLGVVLIVAGLYWAQKHREI